MLLFGHFDSAIAYLHFFSIDAGISSFFYQINAKPLFSHSEAKTPGNGLICVKIYTQILDL